MLQSDVACCRVLHCVAACCSMFDVLFTLILQSRAHIYTQQDLPEILQKECVKLGVIKYPHQLATLVRHCNTLQHTATHCNTLQHIR